MDSEVMEGIDRNLFDALISIRELMFKPRPKNQIKDPNYIRKVKSNIEKLRDYCEPIFQEPRKDNNKFPPRYYRMRNEFVIANLNPVLARIAFVACNCDNTSVLAISQLIISHYNNLQPKPYISLESFQAYMSWLMGNGEMIYDIEPLYYFNKARGVIGSYRELHKNLTEAEFKKENVKFNININDEQCVYLRIGRYCAEEDVQWLIKHHWDDITYGMPKIKRYTLKITKKRLRTMLTDCMIMCGLRTRDIRAIIDDLFPTQDEIYQEGRGDVSKDVVDKARQKLKKELENDAFNKAYQDVIDNIEIKELLFKVEPDIKKSLYLTTEEDLENKKFVYPLTFRAVSALPDSIKYKPLRVDLVQESKAE